MKDIFFQYITNLYHEVPEAIYEGLLSVSCIGTVVFLSILGFKRGIRLLSLLLLIEYVFLLCCSTLIFRSYIECQGHNYSPFWSYEDIFQGKNSMPSPDMVMNVLVFMPVGILLGSGFRSMNWLKALIIGGGISVTIEAMQFFLKRGFSETDDVMHNTFGCMIGYGIYSLVRFGCDKLSRRSMAVL